MSSNPHDVARNAALQATNAVVAGLTRGDWETLEKPLPKAARAAASMLARHKPGEPCTGEQGTRPVLGDNQYFHVRNGIPIFKQAAIPATQVNGKGKGKHGQIKGKSADQIRNKTLSAILGKETAELALLFKKSAGAKLEKARVFPSNTPIEYIGVYLIWCLWYVCRKSVFKAGTHATIALEVIMTAIKFVARVQTMSGPSVADSSKVVQVSQTMIADLKAYIETATSVYKPDGEKIARDNPKMFVRSEFDACIPDRGFTPRDWQRKVAEFTRHGRSVPLFAAICASVGGGKTFLVAYFATMARDTGRKVLYACNSVAVQRQVGQILNWLKIPFAVAVRSKGALSIRPHNSCGKNAPYTKCRVVISSPQLAHEILTTTTPCSSDPQKDFMLVFDEPTIGADQTGSVPLIANMRLFTVFPEWTCVMSGTMPNDDVIQALLKESGYSTKYPTAKIARFESSTRGIGCTVRTRESSVVPWRGCATAAELRKIIESVDADTFLSRMSTHSVLLKLWKTCVELGLKVVDVREVFMIPKNINTEKIQSTALDILRQVAEAGDAAVTQVCASMDVDTYEGTAVSSMKKRGMVLAVDTDATGYAVENFQHVIDKFRAMGLNAKKMIEAFVGAKEVHDAKLAELDANVRGRQCGNKSDETDARGRTEKNSTVSSLDEQRAQMHQNPPKIDFPPSLVVNHAVRALPQLEGLPWAEILPEVSEELLILMLAGVAVYSPHSMGSVYTRVVYALAEKQHLAFLVSDVSIVYGVNLPIGHVILSENFTASHSFNTCIQALGRTGRDGVSWIGNAIVPESFEADVLAYVRDPSSFAQESCNMMAALRDIVSPPETVKVVEFVGAVDAVEAVEYAKTVAPVDTSAALVPLDTQAEKGLRNGRGQDRAARRAEEHERLRAEKQLEEKRLKDIEDLKAKKAAAALAEKTKKYVPPTRRTNIQTATSGYRPAPGNGTQPAGGSYNRREYNQGGSYRPALGNGTQPTPGNGTRPTQGSGTQPVGGGRPVASRWQFDRW